MLELTRQQLRIFPRIQRKYNVSIKFLQQNMVNIEKFLWYALSPRLVIKRTALRKGCRQRIVLDYYHLRRVLFDQADRKYIKARKKNIQQWSPQMVGYLRNKYGTKEYVEVVAYGDSLEEDESVKCAQTANTTNNVATQDVSKQLKEQLELLRSGKRIVPLIEGVTDSATEAKKAKIASDADAQLPEDINFDKNGKTHKIDEDCLPDETDEQAKSKSQIEMTEVTCEENSSHRPFTVLSQGKDAIQNTSETTPKKQIMGTPDNVQDVIQNCKKTKPVYHTDRSMDEEGETETPLSGVGFSLKKCSEETSEALTGSTASPEAKVVRCNSNFLDMLMNKVGATKNTCTEIASTSNVQTNTSQAKTLTSSCQKNQDNGHFTDSSEEFYGFDESEFLPGMMRTPIVPNASKSKGNANSAFVSERLNKFMRENLLESTDRTEVESAGARKQRHATLDGLVTPDSLPPYMDMPLVPESLQKLRTVAERRQYLQKFSKNHKLAIINNEATVYRELQRKARTQKSKSVSQQMLQAPNAQMPFTRQGWQAASFIATECNRYYYQTIEVDNGSECVRLPGVRGNNEERKKRPYRSRVTPKPLTNCRSDCVDALIWRDLKPIRSMTTKKKLNKSPLPSVFKPCPLSHKPFQKPLDDETAPLLLAGGSMAVVRMPTVELEVFPAVGKPLHDVAKRYLQYILPHEDISREWAEFSVSTLQSCVSKNSKLDDTKERKSFIFPIPYLNDRNHILVRRVVDRSEKLDQSFEMAKHSENAVLEDLSFRQNLDENDDILMDCANVVSDLINSVAISCSENSFIKEDPDGLFVPDCVKPTKTESIITDCATNKETVKDDKIDKIIPNRNEDIKTCPLTALPNKKQNRLLLELRRLNATIIDAGVKSEKEVKPCSKDYCALGCVCTSLADNYPLRDHCGKSKCVIECICKGSNQSRIMRLETDGRSITTEDAFMLRRKATARLARMEKEFTSTIVLTENETLLINESQYDKKRRCTKAPKRYDDFADTDDDFTRTSVSPSKKPQNTAVVTIESNESMSSNGAFSETATELREPIYVEDNVLAQLKHCNVSLVPFEDINNMSVWCMVHELYKCFCGGRAIEGKPLVIEKDPNTTSAHSNVSVGGDEEYVTVAKARYSFEKVEESDSKLKCNKISKEEDEDDVERIDEQVESIADDEDSRFSLENDDSDFEDDYPPAKKFKRPQSHFKRGRPSEAKIIDDYFNESPKNCRRAVPVPRKTYIRLNRKRRADVMEFIENNENKQTMLLLNEHILRSVYYHKHEVEKQKKEIGISRKMENKLEIKDEASENKRQQQKQRHIGQWRHSFHSLKSTEEQKRKVHSSENQIVDLTDDDSRQSSLGSTASISSKLKKSRSSLGRQVSDQPKVLLPQKKSENIKSTTANAEDAGEGCNSYDGVDLTNIDEQNSNSVENTEANDTQTVGEFSLDQALQGSSSTADSSNASSSKLADANSTSTGTSSVGLGKMEQPKSRMDFFREVVNSMNNLVNKKMQDIGMALKRESKVIPAPNDDILCIIKWANFLDAFIEEFVYIWQVKMRDSTFFAATVSNMMPMILDAIGVVNIAAVDPKQLPLMGQMLVERCRDPKTRDLAIVMQGRAQYWLVKGFLRADKSSACSKPTPQTHPLLTKKINLLSSLLAKQHVRELNRLMMQQQQQKQQKENQSKKTQQQPDQEKQKEQQPQQQNLTSVPEEINILSKFQNTLGMVKPSQTTQPSPTVNTPPLTKEMPAVAGKELQQKTISNTDQDNVKYHRKKQNVATHSSKVLNQPHKSGKQSKSGTPSQPQSVSKKFKQTQSALIRDLIDCNQYANMKSNIAFRKVTADDVDEIQELDIVSYDHRWLVLDLYNDFSHIFVPDFRDVVSLDRIHKVMSFSKQKQKIVKLQFFQNAPFDAFVAPNSARKIYFGPLKMNMPPPLLILLQSVDGQMMLREVYQAQHNIQSHPTERTTAFWVLRVNGQMHFELDAGFTHVQTPLIELVQSQAENDANDEGSDDDCMIVENDIEAASEPKKTHFENMDANRSKENLPSISVKPLEELQATSSRNPRQLTNFTIQTDVDSNKLQIMQIDDSPQPLNAAGQDMPSLPDDQLQNTNYIPIHLPLNTPLVSLPCVTTEQHLEPQLSVAPILKLPANAVITSVSPAPHEAPYATTIYISSITPKIGVSTATTSVTTTRSPIADTLLQNESTQFSAEEISSKELHLAGDDVDLGEANNSTSTTTVVIAPKITYLTPDVCVTATELSDKAGRATSTTTEKCSPQRPPTADHNVISRKETKGGPKATITHSQQDSLIDSLRNTEESLNGNVPSKLIVGLPNSSSKINLLPTSNNLTISKAVSLASHSNLEKSILLAAQEVTVANSENLIKTVNDTPDFASDAKNDTVTKLPSVPLGKSLPKISTIGSTTITKLDETIVKRLKPVDQLNMTMTLEGDAFEPAASIVFKRNTFAATEENTSSNESAMQPQLRHSLPAPLRVGGVNVYKRTANGVLKAAASTTAVGSIAINSVDTVSKNVVNKPQVLTLQSKTLIASKKLNILTKRPLYSNSAPNAALGAAIANRSVAYSKNATTIGTMVNYGNTATVTIAKTAAATSHSPTAQNVSKSTHRLSLPTIPTQSANQLTSSTRISATVPAVNLSPIINVRAAVPYPQRYKRLNDVSGKLSSKKSLVVNNVNSKLDAASNRAELSGASMPNSAKIKTLVSTNAAETIMVGSATIESKTKSSQDCEYGFFCSSKAGIQKFFGKRINDIFLVKIPNMGTLQKRSIEDVSTYLNQYLSKLYPAMKPGLPLVWKFITKHMNPPIKVIPTSKIVGQRPVKLVEVKKPATIPPTSIGAPSKAVVNAAAAAASSNKCPDTILIED